jgi:hypothetical protein
MSSQPVSDYGSITLSRSRGQERLRSRVLSSPSDHALCAACTLPSLHRHRPDNTNLASRFHPTWHVAFMSLGILSSERNRLNSGDSADPISWVGVGQLSKATSIAQALRHPLGYEREHEVLAHLWMIKLAIEYEHTGGAASRNLGLKGFVPRNYPCRWWKGKLLLRLQLPHSSLTPRSMTLRDR